MNKGQDCIIQFVLLGDSTNSKQINSIVTRQTMQHQQQYHQSSSSSLLGNVTRSVSISTVHHANHANALPGCLIDSSYSNSDSNSNSNSDPTIFNSTSNSKRGRTSVSLSSANYGHGSDIDSGPPQCNPLWILDPMHYQKYESPSTTAFTPRHANIHAQHSIIKQYIHGHRHSHRRSPLMPFDQEDSAEIAKGASALCFMKEQLQFGVGSTAYNLKYGVEIDTDTDTDAAAPATVKRQKQIRGACRLTTTPPTRLALDTIQESKHVNSLHRFVRAELLEVFAIPLTTTQDEHSAPSEKKKKISSAKSLSSRRNLRRNNHSASPPTFASPLSTSAPTPSPSSSYSSARQYPGRVGLRCLYCIHVPKKNTTSAASFFPKNCEDIYRQTCNWQRVHFQHCGSIPLSVKKKYMHLKQNDKTRGKTKYWETSAKTIGLEDGEGRNGIVWKP